MEGYEGTWEIKQHLQQKHQLFLLYTKSYGFLGPYIIMNPSKISGATLDCVSWVWFYVQNQNLQVWDWMSHPKGYFTSLCLYELFLYPWGIWLLLLIGKRLFCLLIQRIFLNLPAWIVLHVMRIIVLQLVWAIQFVQEIHALEGNARSFWWCKDSQVL